MRITFSFVFFLLTVTAPCRAQPQTLEYYMSEAETRSPLLNDYNSQLYALRIDSLKMLADYGYRVSAEGSALYAPNIRGWGYDNAITNGHTLTTVLRGTRTLISKNNLNARLFSFYANMQQVRAQAKLGALQLRKNIADRYVATYISQRQLEATKEIIHLLDQEDAVLKKLARSAVFRQTDYLQFKVTLQQNLLAQQQQTADWYNNFALLNYAAGLVDTLPRPLGAPYMDSAYVVPFDQSIYAENYRADSLKLAADSAVIVYGYKPAVQIFGDGGYQSGFAITPYKNFGIGAGASISLPLYDGRKKQLSLLQNKAQRASRERFYDYAHNQYMQQIAQYRNQINLYRGMIATANEQIKFSRTLIEANARQLPTGDVRVVDFILAINNYLNLKLGLVQYEGNLYNLQNQLRYPVIQ